MTPERVIEWLKQAGAETEDEVEWDFACFNPLKFSKLVGNAKLEEVAQKCEEIDKDSQSQWPKRIATIVRNMKVPTT